MKVALVFMSIIAGCLASIVVGYMWSFTGIYQSLDDSLGLPVHESYVDTIKAMSLRGKIGSPYVYREEDEVFHVIKNNN